MSRHEHSRWLLLLGLTVFGLFQDRPDALAAEQGGGSRYAVLIGVDEYLHTEKLRFSGADVRALAEQLTAAGFAPDHICLLDDKAEQPERRPLKGNIERELGKLLKRTGKNDLVIVTFSGRGVTSDGKWYLLPADAKPDDRSTLLSVGTIEEQLGACPARVKLLVCDASRQEVGQRILPSGRLDSFSQPLELPPNGMVLLSSCAAGEAAHDDADLGHGVFTHFLIEGLRGGADANGDGRVTLTELCVYTDGRTTQHVAQKFNTTQRPSVRGEIDSNFDFSLGTARKASKER